MIDAIDCIGEIECVPEIEFPECCAELDLFDLPIGVVNQPYSGSVTGDYDSISLIGISGFTVDASGTISGIPTSTQTLNGIIRTVKDSVVCDTQITIYVADGQVDPECCANINEISLPAGIAGSQYVGTVDTDADSISLNMNGFSIDQNGTITGNPNSSGIFSGVVTTVKDGNTCSFGIDIFVTEEFQSNACAEITLIEIPTPVVGQFYTGQIVSDADSYSMVGSQFTINQNGLIIGTPTVSGIQTAIVSYTKNGVTCQFTLRFNVAEEPEEDCPKIHSVFAPTGYVGEQYFGFLVADGINNQFSVAGQPSGISVNANTGSFTGTPTQPGTETAVVTINDCEYDVQFLILEREESCPNIISVGKLFGLVGESFVSQIAVESDGPVVFSIDQEIPGVDFVNGIFSGVPTQSGIYEVNVSYSDQCSTKFVFCIVDQDQELPDCVQEYLEWLSESDGTCQEYFDQGYQEWLNCNTGTYSEFITSLCSGNEQKVCMRVISCEHEIDGYKPRYASPCNPIKIYASPETVETFITNGWAIAGCPEKDCYC